MKIDPIKTLSKHINNIPFNKLLGLTIKSIDSNKVILTFPSSENLIGNYLYGILHGGVISSVLDMAGGTAAMVAAIHKKKDATPEELEAHIGKSSTINLHIDYIKPGRGTEFITHAWIMHSGNKITFTRMELYNQAEHLIASGSGTYLIS